MYIQDLFLRIPSANNFSMVGAVLYQPACSASVSLLGRMGVTLGQRHTPNRSMETSFVESTGMLL
jgi:hypothetical protein